MSLPLIAFLALLFYYFCFLLGWSDKPSPTLSFWLFSPSAVIANIAIFAFGWAFLVRWGLTALPFFLITTIYGIIQYPAYFYAFVARPHQIESLEDLRNVFYGLFLCKILLAVFPMAFLLSPDGNRPDVTEPRYWPSFGAVHLHRNIIRGMLWILTTIFAAILGAVVTQTVPVILNWLNGIEIFGN